MRKFKLTEISAVDRPAQAHAKSVIIKRADIDDDDDDNDIELIAKALVIDHVDHGATREDFESEITKRATAAYPGLTGAQSYTPVHHDRPRGQTFVQGIHDGGAFGRSGRTRPLAAAKGFRTCRPCP